METEEITNPAPKAFTFATVATDSGPLSLPAGVRRRRTAARRHPRRDTEVKPSFWYQFKRAFFRQPLYDPCWSCGHSPLIHGEEGCFITVAVTKTGDYFCPCSLPKDKLIEVSHG